MAPSERRALLLLLSLAVAGHAVRRLATRPGQPPGQVELLSSSSGGSRAGSPAAHRDSAAQAAQPLAPGERVDLDRASAQQIARLPRIGLALAKTIVADREANGPFGSLVGLDRVAGVGEGLLRTLEPHAAFSGTPRGSQETGTFLAVAPATALPAPPAASSRLVNVNTASVNDLDALPGVGPARALAIVNYRKKHGPFLSVEALSQVPGIGPAAVAKLRPLVTIR